MGYNRRMGRFSWVWAIPYCIAGMAACSSGAPSSPVGSGGLGRGGSAAGASGNGGGSAGSGGGGAGGIAGAISGVGGAGQSGSSGAGGGAGSSGAGTAGSGATGGSGASCPAGAHCYERSGLVFAATQTEPEFRDTWKPPPGIYKRLEATYRLYLGPWSTTPMGYRHNVLYIDRVKPLDMIGYVQFGRAGNIIIRHGFGQKPVDKAKLTQSASLSPGNWYNIRYVYDTEMSLLTLTVTAADGAPIAQMTDAPDIDALEIKPSDDIGVTFSNPGINPQEVPSFGWEHWDLHIVLTP